MSKVITVLCLLAIASSPGQAQLYCSETKITASDSDIDDRFSDCIATSGDRVVVGSVLDDDNGMSSGSIYIYDWDGTSWVETKVTASDGAAGDLFGASIDISGDRIIVGAYQDDDNGVGSGSVYIYDWDGSNWLETKITASDGDVDDIFGISVGVSGDRIIVGAYQDDDNGVDSGSAYIYDWDGTNWVETKITASDGQDFDWYGDDASISGDRVVIGCVEGGDGGPGVAYLYDWDGTSWVETMITASDGDPFDYFGFRVSISGDRMVVSSFFDDVNGVFSGSAYIYEWNGASWIETKITASDGESGDDYSRDVSIYNDHVIVGAHFDDDNGSNSGSGYYYNWDGTSWVETKLTASDGAAGDRFGRQVAIVDERIVIAANFDDDNATDSGSAYIYDFSPMYYADSDGDGFGDMNSSMSACTAPSGYVTDDTDCDDSNANVYPGAVEICNGIDDDCDGQIDEGAGGNTYYADSDGDGFGDMNISMSACIAPSGYVADDTDCDDANANVYPGAVEICNGIDDDCDGQIDEGAVGNNYYADSDGDGFGDMNNSMSACTAPSGYVADNTDCDDADASVYPGALEICDGIDNDCSGIADDSTLCLCPNGLQQNTFLGHTIFWTDAANWSLGTVPTLCDHVIIPAGLTCVLLASESGECFTLEVQGNASFEVQSGGLFDVVAPG